MRPLAADYMMHSSLPALDSATFGRKICLSREYYRYAKAEFIDVAALIAEIPRQIG